MKINISRLNPFNFHDSKRLVAEQMKQYLMKQARPGIILNEINISYDPMFQTVRETVNPTLLFYFTINGNYLSIILKYENQTHESPSSYNTTIRFNWNDRLPPDFHTNKSMWFLLKDNELQTTLLLDELKEQFDHVRFEMIEKCIRLLAVNTSMLSIMDR